MPAIRLKLSFGPNYSRAGARSGGFDSGKNVATEAFNRVVRLALQRAAGTGRDRILAAIPGVQKDLYADLDAFARTVTRFIFSQKSSARGADLRVAFGGGSVPFVSGFENKILTDDVQVYWPALSAKMLQRKRPDVTYFVYTGKLLFDLEVGGAFPAFLRDVLKPTIRFQEIEEEQPITKRKQRIGQLSISLAASKQGQNLKNMPFLSENPFSGRDDRSLLSRYMGEEIANKLTNAAHPLSSRPIITPMLQYWVMQRFPAVAKASLEKHFKLRTRNDGTADTFTQHGS